MSIFDIIGPVIVGPSSSHTAGAVRIAKVARELLGEEVKKAVIRLHGSFAKTYKGHGTDRAIIGGLLGFSTDDQRIKKSLSLAKEAGMQYSIQRCFLGDVHPNTALIKVEGVSGRKVSILGSSVGGGSIVIRQVNGLKVNFTGQYYTLLVEHEDKPNMVAVVTLILGRNNINIAGMRVYRAYRGANAIMIIETDQKIDSSILKEIELRDSILSVTGIDII